jgi:CHAD domain-containing protein
MSKAATGTRRCVDEVLAEAAAVIKVRNKDLLKWPDDDEHLHQYRISVRVARSLVKFLKPYQNRNWNAELLGKLKTLQDPTSRMRELDVLVPLLKDEPELQERCREVQLANRKAFIADLKRDQTQELVASVAEALKHVAWRKGVKSRGIRARELAQRVSKRRDACETTLLVVDFDDQEAVHDLRKQAKALRYVARELQPCLPEGAADVSEDMHEVQDKLGAWCDARVNAALIAEICGDAGAERSAAFQAQAEEIMQELKSSRG